MESMSLQKKLQRGQGADKGQGTAQPIYQALLLTHSPHFSPLGLGL